MLATTYNWSIPIVYTVRGLINVHLPPLAAPYFYFFCLFLFNDIAYLLTFLEAGNVTVLLLLVNVLLYPVIRIGFIRIPYCIIVSLQCPYYAYLHCILVSSLTKLCHTIPNAISKLCQYHFVDAYQKPKNSF